VRPEPTCFGSAFAARVRADPDAPFAEHAGHAVSRGEVMATAATLARAFRAAETGPDDCVALVCEDHLRAVEAMIALWSLGAAPMFLDIRQPLGEILGAAERAGAKRVWSDLRRLHAAPEIDALPPREAPVPGAAPLAFPDGRERPVCFAASSGTTSVPVHTPRLHGPFLKRTEAASVLAGRAASTTLCCGGPAFGAILGMWLRCIVAGSLVISLPLFFRIEELDASLRDPRVKWAGLPPVLVRDLLRLHRHRDTARDGPAYPGLETLNNLGGPISPADLEAACERLCPRMRNTYSMTGVGMVSYVRGEEIARRPGSVGKPPPEVRVRILDDAGRERPAGETGEIHATGAGSTREVATGDIGHLDDDEYLYVTGRGAQMACRRGVSINLLALERDILAHPAVRDCAAFAIPDDDGAGDAIAVAIESETERSALVGWLRSTLAATRRPDLVWTGPSAPRTPSGKLALRILKDRANRGEEAGFARL